MLHGRSAHEHHRTWQGFPRVITRAGGTHRVGLAPLPLLWRDADAQVGWYTRHPWTLAGRQVVRVQRHSCERCDRTYSEQSPWLVRGSWYAREVHRFTLDHWQHVGSSLRRTAEWTRSLLGQQERWRLWRPLDAGPPDDATACHLSGSTVQRWLDQAGQAARRSVNLHRRHRRNSAEGEYCEGPGSHGRNRVAEPFQRVDEDVMLATHRSSERHGGCRNCKRK